MSSKFFSTFTSVFITLSNKAFTAAIVFMAQVFVAQPVFAQQAASKPSIIEQFMPFVFILAIFWFFIIRPQQKRAKSHRSFLQEIKRGDSVLTSSGILGTIEGLTDKYITLEISEGVRIRMLRSQIASKANEES